MRYIGTIFLWILLVSSMIAQTAIAPAVGSGTEDIPYEIASLENLYWIAASDDVVPDPDQATRWSSHYIQTADIDASETVDWFGGGGWRSIGYWQSPMDNSPFSGSYNGQGHTIDFLYINRPASSYRGLLGYTADSTLENLGITNVEITGHSWVGGLVGKQWGSTIVNCYSTGNVSGNNNVGGLAGEQSESEIKNSYSEVNVSGIDNVGGLVGNLTSDSIISNSYSTGSVDGENVTGGLAGRMGFSTISESYNAGNVSGNTGTGGLVGEVAHSTINKSYSTGSVSGSIYLGGLVGHLQNSSISESYSMGDVSGSADFYVGGLIGASDFSDVNRSYSTGAVEGVFIVGGLMGSLWNSTISNCYSTGSVSGVTEVGGLAGLAPYSVIEESYSSGSVSGSYGVGGLIGVLGDFSTVNNSYSRGSVNGINQVGGLVGQIVDSTISNSFCTGFVHGSGGDNIGGLSGSQIGSSFGDSYWDTETSAQSSSAGGEGRTTDQMTWPYAENTYLGWDFLEIWAADENYNINDGYPYLSEMPVSVEDDHIAVIEPLSLYNYPNPFNPETVIRYSLKEDVAMLELKIYNIRGQLVRTLVGSSPHPEGEYQVVWDGRDDSGKPVTSGVYFYRMITPDVEQVNKMLLLK